MRKRSQAALEFLMTYGWAMLVVGIVIGAMAYFGVIDPSVILPEKCVFPIGLHCKNYQVNTKGSVVNFELENALGQGVLIKGMTVEGKGFDTCSIDTNYRPFSDTYNSKTGWHIGPGESSSAVVHCKDIQETVGKVKAAVNIIWMPDNSPDAFAKTMEGELLAKVEAEGEEFVCCDFKTQFDWPKNAWRPVSDCSITTTPEDFFTCDTSQEVCCYGGSSYFWLDAATCVPGNGLTIDTDENCFY